MHKNIFLKQIFEEGFATTFYKPQKELINKYIKNKFINKTLNFLLEIIYIIFLIIIVLIIFNLTFPL